MVSGQPRGSQGRRRHGLSAALRRCCPRCGSPGIWRAWGELHPSCPGCGLGFAREEGYWVGVVVVNLAVAELVLAVGLGLAALATWPDVPWGWLAAAGIAAMIALPLWFYPRAKTLWLWLDLRVHPQDAAEPPPAGSPRG